ncbi:ATP-dependent DNA helicase PIF1-like [Rhizophagus irregularis DAOM 181602=DAOM 197198]|nr:ATP-dependent DNA helicase PIF1-like [Rhizophagus irregularis DAOM 181602=DAOM 197198]
MMPERRERNSSDFDVRDIDINHDWVNESWLRYPEMEEVESFIQRAINDSDVNQVRKNSANINYETLNEKQKLIFERIESHYIAATSNQSMEALRIIVMGTAGTGKSYLINAIRERLQQATIVLAPTGVAAFNIQGSTIHSALSIPISGTTYKLAGESLRKLQNKLKDIHYFIVDEMSMVGRLFLALIDLWLRQAFPECSNIPFGGRSLILFGDFGQLPPVRDLPMYAKDPRLSNNLSEDGRKAYSQFREIYKLVAVQRQSGNSDRQRKFRDLLTRMRDGESTQSDWELLMTRVPENLTESERRTFLNAINIIPTWEEVDRINLEKLRSLNQPIAKIRAVHTGGPEASKADSETAKGLESELLLARNTRVMLTANLWVGAGLVNGAIGTITDILYKEKAEHTSLPTVILVSFDKYDGPTLTNIEGIPVVPIVPIRRMWEGKSGTCSRLQIPLSLAWAITVHKSQGLTLTKAVIDLGRKEFAAGLSFVAISHVRSLDDILFRHFTFNRLQNIKSCIRLKERIAAEEKLLEMEITV